MRGGRKRGQSQKTLDSESGGKESLRRTGLVDF